MARSLTGTGWRFGRIRFIICRLFPVISEDHVYSERTLSGRSEENWFEPAQPLALAFRKNEAEAVISLSVDDPRLERYLKGETLTIEPEEAAHSKGWHLLCVEGYPLGFGKLVNGTLKNKYPAGWRV